MSATSQNHRNAGAGDSSSGAMGTSSGMGTSNGMGTGNGRGNNGTYAAVGEVPDDVVTVLRGRPDEDELAALVAGIVATRAGGHEEVDDGTSTSLWTNHGHRLGMDPRAARAAWRWSAHAQH